MKKFQFCGLVTLVAMLSCGMTQAQDKDLADALAAAGASHAAKGNLNLAKDTLYKALVNDESCPEAVFELAKIFDKEGNSAAGDFYQRASVLLAQDPKPSNSAKRTEALNRAKVLNPFVPRMSTVLEDYAIELDKLVKKNTDTLTQDAALERVTQLKLASALPPEKMPKFYAGAVAAAAAAAKAKKDEATASKSRSSSSSSFGSSRVEKVTGQTAPDVEKELKALGWATVKGVFVKKGPGLYEATDAQLEAPKINGAIDLWFVKEGSKGYVKATTRTDKSEESSFGSSYYFESYSSNGYGYHIRAKDYREYGPSTMYSSNNVVEPYQLGSFPMPETPKVHFLVTIMEGDVEFTVNEKRNNKMNHKKTPKTGTFVIDITGTVILETPRCMGQ